MKLLTVVVTILMLTTSCAMILNPKYQPVNIKSEEKAVVKINGEEPEQKKGKYLMERNGRYNQIMIEKDGYIDEQIAVAQTNLSGWVIVSYLALIPGYIDHAGKKALNYSGKGFSIYPSVMDVVDKTDDMKELRVNNVSVNLPADKIRYRYFDRYKRYVQQQYTTAAKVSKKEKGLKVENSAFSLVLNEFLTERGYIDTTESEKVIASSYGNNLYVDSDLYECTLHTVGNLYGSDGMLYVDIAIKWDLLDYYKNEVYSEEMKSTSGQFIYTDIDGDYSEIVFLAIGDATERAMAQFINKEEVQKALKDKTEVAEQEEREVITFTQPSKYVSTLGEAIQSSVTVKTKDGHGSGFVVSEDGYIITNYHVVAGNQDNLKIKLNNEEEHEAKVVRVNKNTDLALLKIEKKGFIPFQLNKSKDIEIGKDIYAVGTPTAEDLSQTVSKGIISGVRKADGDSKLIQTDASVNGGNSGGALITKEGLVLGVVRSKLIGAGIEGVAFGIPAYEVLEQLKIEVK